MNTLARSIQPDMFPDQGELNRAVGFLTQKFIWYYPNLAQLAGGHKAALMLGGLVNWTRYLSIEQPERHGWIWKTQQEWLEETGLSRHEQDSARKELAKLGLIQQQKRGMPARMYYRINLQALGLRLSAMLKCHFERWDWSNSALVLRLLGRPISFYLQLAKITESATCSLLLSYYISAQRGAVNAALTTDWISPRSITIEQRLGLSYKTQLLARKKLANLGVLDQRLSSSMAPKPEVRLRYSRMVDLLAQASSKSDVKVELSTDMHQAGANSSSGDQGFTFSANRDLPFRQTGNAQTGKQEITFSANTECPNRQTSLPKRETSIYTHTYKQPLQQDAQTDKLEKVGCSGDQENAQTGRQPDLIELDFTGVDQAWQSNARHALQQLPVDQRQAVLDEWVGRFGVTHDPMRFPLRFLDRLIETAIKGSFRAELGVSVAAQRHGRLQAAKVQAQIQQLSQTVVQLPKSADSTEEAVTSLAKQQAFAKIAELRKSWGVSRTPPSNASAVPASQQSLQGADQVQALEGGLVVPTPSNASTVPASQQQPGADQAGGVEGVELPHPSNGSTMPASQQSLPGADQVQALEGGVVVPHPSNSNVISLFGLMRQRSILG